MKLRFDFKIFGLISFAILLVAFVVYQRPMPGVSWTPSRTIGVHDMNYGTLRLSGKVFRNLLGGPPYFICSNDGQIIAFVSQETGGKKQLHLADLPSGSIESYPINHSSFIGEEIGSSGLGGGWEFIKVIEKDKLVIEQKHGDILSLYTIHRKIGDFEVSR